MFIFCAEFEEYLVYRPLQLSNLLFSDIEHKKQVDSKNINGLKWYYNDHNKYFMAYAYTIQEIYTKINIFVLFVSEN